MTDRSTRFLLTLLALLSVLASDAVVAAQRRGSGETRIERILVGVATRAQQAAPIAHIRAIPASRLPFADGPRPLHRSVVRHDSRGPPLI